MILINSTCLIFAPFDICSPLATDFVSEDYSHAVWCRFDWQDQPGDLPRLGKPDLNAISAPGIRSWSVEGRRHIACWANGGNIKWVLHPVDELSKLNIYLFCFILVKGRFEVAGELNKLHYANESGSTHYLLLNILTHDGWIFFTSRVASRAEIQTTS